MQISKVSFQDKTTKAGNSSTKPVVAMTFHLRLLSCSFKLLDHCCMRQYSLKAKSMCCRVKLNPHSVTDEPCSLGHVTFSGLRYELVISKTGMTGQDLEPNILDLNPLLHHISVM